MDMNIERERGRGRESASAIYMVVHREICRVDIYIEAIYMDV